MQPATDIKETKGDDTVGFESIVKRSVMLAGNVMFRYVVEAVSFCTLFDVLLVTGETVFVIKYETSALLKKESNMVLLRSTHSLIMNEFYSSMVFLLICFYK